MDTLIETEKRLIDANLNRLREGIRVLEDIARYILNDLPLSSELKELRHKARVANSTNLLQYRDIKNDILKTSTPSEKRRENLRDIVVANFKRSEESARVLEEIFKLDSANQENSSLRADSQNLRGNPPYDFNNCGLPRSHSLARNDEIDRDSSLHKCSAQNDKTLKNAESVLDSANQGQSTKSLCEIFKAIRYDLYDIEIAYFGVLEKIENKDEK